MLGHITRATVAAISTPSRPGRGRRAPGQMGGQKAIRVQLEAPERGRSMKGALACGLPLPTPTMAPPRLPLPGSVPPLALPSMLPECPLPDPLLRHLPHTPPLATTAGRVGPKGSRKGMRFGERGALKNFVTRAVAPGKAYLRWLYDAMVELCQPQHHTQIMNAIWKNLQVWSTFLQSFNGVSF